MTGTVPSLQMYSLAGEIDIKQIAFRKEEGIESRGGCDEGVLG